MSLFNVPGYTQKERQSVRDFWFERYHEQAENPVKMSPSGQLEGGYGLWDASQYAKQVLRQAATDDRLAEDLFLLKDVPEAFDHPVTAAYRQRKTDMEKERTDSCGADRDRLDLMMKAENKAYNDWVTKEHFQHQPQNKPGVWHALENAREDKDRAFSDLYEYDKRHKHPLTDPERDLAKEPPHLVERRAWMWDRNSIEKGYIRDTRRLDPDNEQELGGLGMMPARWMTEEQRQELERAEPKVSGQFTPSRIANAVKERQDAEQKKEEQRVKQERADRLAEARREEPAKEAPTPALPDLVERPEGVKTVQARSTGVPEASQATTAAQAPEALAETMAEAPGAAKNTRPKPQELKPKVVASNRPKPVPLKGAQDNNQNSETAVSTQQGQDRNALPFSVDLAANLAARRAKDAEQAPVVQRQVSTGQAMHAARQAQETVTPERQHAERVAERFEKKHAQSGKPEHARMANPAQAQKAVAVRNSLPKLSKEAKQVASQPIQAKPGTPSFLEGVQSRLSSFRKAVGQKWDQAMSNVKFTEQWDRKQADARIAAREEKRAKELRRQMRQNERAREDKQEQERRQAAQTPRAVEAPKAPEPRQKPMEAQQPQSKAVGGRAPAPAPKPNPMPARAQSAQGHDPRPGVMQIDLSKIAREHGAKQQALKGPAPNPHANLARPAKIPVGQPPSPQALAANKPPLAGPRPNPNASKAMPKPPLARPEPALQVQAPKAVQQVKAPAQAAPVARQPVQGPRPNPTATNKGLPPRPAPQPGRQVGRDR